jgi:hypothetical protein
VDVANTGRRYGRIDTWPGPNPQTTVSTVGAGAQHAGVAARVGLPSTRKTSSGACRLAREITEACANPTHRTGTPVATRRTTRGTKTRTTRQGGATGTTVGGRTSRSAGPDPARQPTHGKEQPTHGKEQPTHGNGQPTHGKEQPIRGKEQPTHGNGQPIRGNGQPTHGNGQPIRRMRRRTRGKGGKRPRRARRQAPAGETAGPPRAGAAPTTAAAARAS